MSSSSASLLGLGCLLWLAYFLWLNRHLWWPRLIGSQSVSEEVQPKGPRALKPRPPSDCANCRTDLTTPAQAETTSAAIIPYAQQKSKRGRKKQSHTDGYACPNPDCKQRGNADSATHALVANGHHGKQEPIQDFKCQLCGTKITVRRDTPLYRLKTPSQKVALVLALAAEGLTVAAVSFVFGISEATVETWLTRAGLHAQRLHTQRLQHLHFNLIQFDELRTTLRQLKDDIWLWFALDPQSKLLVVMQLGSRNQQMAHAVVHALVTILNPACLPVFLSDGLDFYFYALSAHFGHWVDDRLTRKRVWQVRAELLYGQIKKIYRRRRLTQVEERMRAGSREQLAQRLQGFGFSGKLQTAFVERINLTVRRSVASLARRTAATAQFASDLLLHLEWWRAYYHFIRPHESLRQPLAQPRVRGGRLTPQCYRQRTPAMAAGLTDHRWTVLEFLQLPLPPTTVGYSSAA